ncbi:MAG: hypothetical protein P8R42_14685 [Candidatus Binatia bacterium]|nr:hypothetical protein [Candidatus Binatia bacterium]
MRAFSRVWSTCTVTTRPTLCSGTSSCSGCCSFGTGIGFGAAKLDDVQHLTGILEEGESELSDARLRSVITMSAVLNVAHTPTPVTWERTGKLSDYPRLRADPAARVLPRYFRDVLWNPKNAPRFRDRTPQEWRAPGAPYSHGAGRSTQRIRDHSRIPQVLHAPGPLG